ncbi:prenyltransferase [Lacimicrobium sp. SS2-24]|uniref:prenyltransferase n=1 Tax=Lacimicrobium sp. SS2-24 TaxID=2005569 RepID=UPI000B4A5D62|nr:prenyltransferase [Lacimicrobium sp. SS2-24]
MIGAVVRSMRPPFLLLSLMMVFLAVALVYYQQGTVDPARAALIMLIALSGHISVNCLNEYQDFRSGLDLMTHKTPFSGGSGALPSNPQAAPVVLMVAIISLISCFVSGLILIDGMGWKPYVLGILGILLVLTYTRWLNRMPLLCLIAPGTGFALVMLLGAVIVLSDTVTSVAMMSALLPFCLVNNLLLVNQYPDIAADTEVGRRTLPGYYGVEVARRVYAMLALLSALSVTVVLIMIESHPVGWLIVLPLALSVWIYQRLTSGQYQTADFRLTMALNVLLTLLMPLLLSLCLIGARWG